MAGHQTIRRKAEGGRRKEEVKDNDELHARLNAGECHPSDAAGRGSLDFLTFRPSPFAFRLHP
jgi:hypothetical protein